MPTSTRRYYPFLRKSNANSKLPNGAMWASPLTQTWKIFRKVRRGGRLCPPKGSTEFAEDFRVSGMHFAGRTETSAHMGYRRILRGFVRTALCRHSRKGKESRQTRRASARFSDQRRLTAEKKASYELPREKEKRIARFRNSSCMTCSERPRISSVRICARISRCSSGGTE